MLEYIFEFFGVFTLILVMLTIKHWFIIGLTVAILLLIGTHFYKASFNPVVSIANYINHDISLGELSLLIFAETMGSLAAIFVYKMFIKNSNLNKKK